MLRYAISDRGLFAGDDAAKQAAVVRQAALLASEGVDFFQVREKELALHELATLAAAVRDVARRSTMRVLLNGPANLAGELCVGLHGSPQAVLAAPAGSYSSVSCHTLGEMAAVRNRVESILFGPVFEKQVRGVLVAQGTGLALLKQACTFAGSTPVLALGGVSEANAGACLQAGAAGIAGIRLFVR